MAIHYQTSDNGPVMLVTISQPGGGYCGHRILLNGPQAGMEVSYTKVCDTREEAMAIMLRSPPILTLTNGTSAPENLRVYDAIG